MNRVKRTLALVAILVLAGCAHPMAMRAQQRTTTATPAPATTPNTAARKSPRNLAIFIFDGVQIIDYTGPYEVLGHAWEDEHQLFNIYTVAEKAAPIITNMGMTVTPKYTFANMPQADVLVLPGGDTHVAVEDPAVIKWVQDTTTSAEYVMSVCNGAFYLAKAGLLDGLTATTFHGLIDELKTAAPKTRVVIDQRFVDNGKIITTAGLSSGMDGALHLIERISGHGQAQAVALALEYNWQPDSGYARASFADRYLRKMLGREGFKLPEGTGWKVLGQQGGKDDWQKDWEVRLDVPAADLLKLVDGKLAESWARRPTASAAAGLTESRWQFNDEDGKPWRAVASVQPLPHERGTYKLSIKLARADAAASARLD
jgi:putative intracellular protease/amidase